MPAFINSLAKLGLILEADLLVEEKKIAFSANLEAP